MGNCWYRARAEPQDPKVGEFESAASADIYLIINGLHYTKRTVCSSPFKRKRDTLLPMLEHAIAYLTEFLVRFHIGVHFL